MKYILGIFLTFTFLPFNILASEKFSIDGNILIYDTENVQNEETGIVWNDEELVAWISAKKVKVAKFGKDVKKSKMIFAGLRKQAQIDDMIAYLKSLK